MEKLKEAFEDSKPSSKEELTFKNIVQITTLERWGGVPSRKMFPYEIVPSRVYFMNTSSQECHDPLRCRATVLWLQNHKMVVEERNDTRFNFLIGGDGNVYEARGLSSQPLLPIQYRGYGPSSILLGLIGKFTNTDIPPDMHKTALDLIYNFKRNGFLQERATLQYILHRQKTNVEGLYATTDPNHTGRTY